MFFASVASKGVAELRRVSVADTRLKAARFVIGTRCFVSVDSNRVAKLRLRKRTFETICRRWPGIRAERAGGKERESRLLFGCAQGKHGA